MKPSNASYIMIYKIVFDYEKHNKVSHTLQDLVDYTTSVFKYANDKNADSCWSIDTKEIKPYILRLCDISEHECVLNIDKYNNNGKYFADQFLGSLPYHLLEGCMAINRAQDVIEVFRENFTKLSPDARTKYLTEYGFDFGLGEEESTEQTIN